MRHAIYYEDHRRVGRNDGSPLYFWNVLKNQMGLDVTHLLPDPRTLAQFGKFDVNWWVDYGEDALQSMMDYKPIRCPSKSIYVTSDTHLGFDYRLSKATEFDHVFCNQKRAVEEFALAGVKATWMPHAFEPKAYPKKLCVPKYDICFVGHVNSANRIDFLDRMFKEFPNFFFGKRLFEDAADVFSKSKIVLNVSIKDDVNMRVFETLGSGNFLLTNWLPTLGELFEDGKHLVTYKTHDEAVEKAHYYLKNDAAREKIALAGYNEAISKHTYKHRVESIMEHAGIKEAVTCP